MFNWNTDTKKINRKDKEVWQLEQLVNFGLGGSKINAKSLKKNWPKLKLDPKRKTFLKFILS